VRSGSTGDLPFTWQDLRDAIPKRCFVASTGRSLVHLALDVALLGALYALSAWVSSPAWYAPIAFAQGTLFWAIFLVGHDCGHGAFSRRRGWNEGIGHLVHTPLLVPYHAWRLSHRAHHRHTGDVERDEAWPPLTERQIRALPALSRFVRLRAFFLAFPLYLLRNGPARRGSHFDPDGPLFRERERPLVRRSVRACALMAAGLGAAAFAFGPLAVLHHYVAPYCVFAAWASLVTYLQHTDPELPWHRGAAWSPLRGALTTVDRRFGPFESIHHHVGTHAVHHLFPRIPHYRLREADAAIRPILGEHGRVSDESVLRALWRAARGCQVIPESGERVFYEALRPRAAAPWAPPGRAGSSPATR